MSHLSSFEPVCICAIYAIVWLMLHEHISVGYVVSFLLFLVF